jgi:predicted dehydrogenase
MWQFQIQNSASPSSAPARSASTTPAFTPNSPPAGAVEFTGIFDANADAAKKIAAKHKLHIFNSIAEAAAASDALNIVTPTVTHFEIAKQLLAQGKHVLVEKPMTDDTAQAAELIQIAQQKNCVLQVGHVERFNPVFKYLETAAPEPRFIETHRLSPYPARSTDIGVVLDLMIHDLDVVLAFVKSPVTAWTPWAFPC